MFNRREFLQQSAVGALGLSLPVGLKPDDHSDHQVVAEHDYDKIIFEKERAEQIWKIRNDIEFVLINIKSLLNNKAGWGDDRFSVSCHIHPNVFYLFSPLEITKSITYINPSSYENAPKTKFTGYCCLSESPSAIEKRFKNWIDELEDLNNHDDDYLLEHIGGVGYSISNYYLQGDIKDLSNLNFESNYNEQMKTHVTWDVIQIGNRMGWSNVSVVNGERFTWNGLIKFSDDESEKTFFDYITNGIKIGMGIERKST